MTVGSVWCDKNFDILVKTKINVRHGSVLWVAVDAKEIRARTLFRATGLPLYYENIVMKKEYFMI